MKLHHAVLTIAFLLAAPMAGFAHEGHLHKLMGTVTAVHADRNHVEIKTVKGETAEFLVDANTKFLKGTSAVTLAALTPGTRVVAEGKMADKTLVAATVRLGTAAAPAAAKAPARSTEHAH
jgi:hypothetical protein